MVDILNWAGLGQLFCVHFQNFPWQKSWPHTEELDWIQLSLNMLLPLDNYRMRKRQVVLRRSEPSRASITTSVATARTVRYKECQKNHAASVGGYAIDGCREFMASSDVNDESSTPTINNNAMLMCAACGCHRNFHKRQVETEVMASNPDDRV